MWDTEKEVQRCLYSAFESAVQTVTGKKPVTKRLAEVKVGKTVFNDGLTFVVEKHNGFVVLSNGKKFPFLTAVKMTVKTET